MRSLACFRAQRSPGGCGVTTVRPQTAPRPSEAQHRHGGERLGPRPQCVMQIRHRATSQEAPGTARFAALNTGTPL